MGKRLSSFVEDEFSLAFSQEKLLVELQLEHLEDREGSSRFLIRKQKHSSHHLDMQVLESACYPYPSATLGRRSPASLGLAFGSTWPTWSPRAIPGRRRASGLSDKLFSSERSAPVGELGGWGASLGG